MQSCNKVQKNAMVTLTRVQANLTSLRILEIEQKDFVIFLAKSSH